MKHIKSRRLRQSGHKAETDRYDYDWREIATEDGDTVFKRMVWASAFVYDYDSSHIGLCKKRENRVQGIIENDNTLVTSRYKNAVGESKFRP